MTFDKERIAHLAALSRLDGEKLADMEDDLNQILAYMETLDAVDTSAVSLRDGAWAVPLRADEVRASYPRETLLACAPDSDGEGYLVPKTVEG